MWGRLRRSLGKAIALVTMAGCAIAGPSELVIEPDVLDTEPRETRPVMGGVQPVGPVVELARGREDGREFSVTVWRDVEGACMDAEVEGARTVACGREPGDQALPAAFGLVSTGGMWEGGPIWAVGLVDPRATTVALEMDGAVRGRASLVSVAPTGMDAQLFVVIMPTDVGPHDLVAVDADGEELGRLEFQPAGAGWSRGACALVTACA